MHTCIRVDQCADHEPYQMHIGYDNSKFAYFLLFLSLRARGKISNTRESFQNMAVIKCKGKQNKNAFNVY